MIFSVYNFLIGKEKVYMFHIDFQIRKFLKWVYTNDKWKVNFGLMLDY